LPFTGYNSRKETEALIKEGAAICQRIFLCMYYFSMTKNFDFSGVEGSVYYTYEDVHYEDGLSLLDSDDRDIFEVRYL
jgi:hypothetical protein